MSRIDLTRADLQPLEFTERFDLPADAGGDDLVSARGLELAGAVEKAGHGYVLDGRLRGAVELQCARCLTQFSVSLDEAVELVLVSAGEAPKDEETRLGRDELEVRFFDEPMIELSELAVEQLLLAVPIKPLCSEGCKGLCSRCGANLNQGPCSCPPEKDERWASLQDWRPSE